MASWWVMAASIRVLVIDDSDVARAATCDVVRSVGLEPIELPTPIGATREIIRHEIKIVILDVNMPSMSGDKLATLFRANPRFAGLRILLISGAPSSEMQRLVLDSQADGYVSKAELRVRLPDLLRKFAPAIAC